MGLPNTLITFTFPVIADAGVIVILVGELTTNGTLVAPICTSMILTKLVPLTAKAVPTHPLFVGTEVIVGTEPELYISKLAKNGWYLLLICLKRPPTYIFPVSIYIVRMISSGCGCQYPNKPLCVFTVAKLDIG